MMLLGRLHPAVCEVSHTGHQLFASEGYDGRKQNFGDAFLSCPAPQPNKLNLYMKLLF